MTIKPFIKKMSVHSLLIISLVQVQVEAAENTKIYSLLDTYQMAVENDARFNAAHFDRKAGLEQLPQARSRLLPSISINADVNYTDQETDYSGVGPFTSGQRDFRSDNVGLKLTQPIYRKDRFEAYKQAKISVRQADTRLAIAGQKLMLALTRAYFDVLLAQDTVKLAKKQRLTNKEKLASAKKGLEVGSAVITDVHDTQARYDLAVSREINANHSEQIARRTLSKLIGIYPQNLMELREHLPLIPSSPDKMEYWAELAAINNLNVRFAQETLEIASHEIERSRGLAYPSLDLVLRYDNNSADNSSFGVGTDTTEKMISLEAKIPLYSGGIVGSVVRQKTAARQSARLQLDATRSEARLLAEEAYLSIASVIQRIQALEQALLSSKQSLASTQRGFELGLRTSIDVLDAQQQLFTAKNDLAKAKYDYLYNRLQLKAATGKLAQQDLEEINQLMNN